MTKMTYVNAIDFALQVLNENHFDGIEEEKAVVMDKLEALKASIEKRNTGDRKPTKTQVANEGIKADILAFLADGEKHTVTEIMSGVASLADASNQKAATLVTALVKAELVKREEIKRKAYFSIA